MNKLKMMFGMTLELVAILLAILAGYAGGGAGEIFLVVAAIVVAIGGIVVCIIAMNGAYKDSEKNAGNDGCKDGDNT